MVIVYLDDLLAVLNVAACTNHVVQVGTYLEELKEAGLGSLPGTAAEVLDDEVRETLCPDKLRTREWLEVVRAAHRKGLATTSTIMFGHIEVCHMTPLHVQTSICVLHTCAPFCRASRSHNMTQFQSR